MSSEGDCAREEQSDRVQRQDQLPREVWLLIAANVVVALGYGVVAPVLPQYARHFGVSISAATFVITAFALMRLVCRAARRIAGATGGGEAGLRQRSGDRGVVHRCVRLRANVLAAAAFPVAGRPGIGDVHGVLAGSDDPDLAAGRAWPRRGHVLVGIPHRVGRRTGAGQPDRGPGLGGAVHDLRRRAVGRRGGGFREPAEFRGGGCRKSTYRARCFGADGAAAQGVSRRAVLQLRDGLGGVRPAHRAGAAVRRRGAGLRRGLRGTGAGDVRDRQHLRRHPQRVSVGPDRAAQAAHRRPDGVGGVDGSRRLHVVAAGVPGGGPM